MCQGINGQHKLLSETTLILLGGRVRWLLAVLVCAVALAIASAFAVPARAQSPLDGDPSAGQSAPGDPEVSLEYFRERLSPYGEWVDHPTWGDVWRPDVGDDFRPYFDGYWEYTSDHGSLWISNEPFGDIVYHYGRWVFDRAQGWLWVPGYIWAPSWVLWRANNDYVGWLPMPPGYLDYQQLFTSPYLTDRWYGYYTFYGPIYGPTFVTEHYFTLWVFVLKDDLIYRHGVRHVSDIRTLRSIYYGSTDYTDYDVEQDRVVDRSIDRSVWQRRGERVNARPARDFLRDDAPLVSVSRGRDIDRRHAEDRSARRPTPRRADAGADEVGGARAGASDPASSARAATMRESPARIRERRAGASATAQKELGARARTPSAALDSTTAANEPTTGRGVSADVRSSARPYRPSTDRLETDNVERGAGAVATPRPPAPLSSMPPRPLTPRNGTTSPGATSASRGVTARGSAARPVTGTAASTPVPSSPALSVPAPVNAASPAAASAPAATRSAPRGGGSRPASTSVTRGLQGRGL